MPVNATLSALDRAGAAEQAARAVQEGFECLKLKVGVGDDAGRVAAVRAAAGPQVALRLDANGAWGVEEAVQRSTRSPRPDSSWSRSPRTAWRRCARCASGWRCASRSTRRPASTARSRRGVADAVCLKISRCGGIAGLLAAATLVRASGAEVYLASTLDGPLGVAAAVHAAAALASRGAAGALRPGDAEPVRGARGPAAGAGGRDRRAAPPGLGVEPF